MDRMLARLERRWGRYAISGLTYYLVAAQGLVLVLELGKPGFSQLLVMDRERILAGELWRLFTYVLIPASVSPLWGLFAVYWLYIMGTNLEAQWGHFKYQVFWLLGMVFTTTFALLLGIPATGTYLVMALFLAFATLWPEYTILVFFILPIKVKWLALLDVLALAAEVGRLPGEAKLMPVLAVANYLVFFAPELVDMVRRYVRQARRSKEFTRFKVEASDTRPGVRQCKACGLSSAQDPRAEFRICICEKCGGKPTEFCMQHIGNH
ncbi:MAG: rhomboid family intramembrane serine protease [Deltaproteobacteria bacterium]|nr:rhomboid family intramembrane serine protease [Deltaproteobacteria bacterium]